MIYVPDIIKQPRKFTEFGQRKGKTECHVSGRPQSRFVPAVGVTNHSKKREQWIKQQMTSLIINKLWRCYNSSKSNKWALCTRVTLWKVILWLRIFGMVLILNPNHIKVGLKEIFHLKIVSGSSYSGIWQEWLCNKLLKSGLMQLDQKVSTGWCWRVIKTANNLCFARETFW